MARGESITITPSEGYVASGTVEMKHGFANIPGWGTGTYSGIAWLGQKSSRPEPSWGLVEVAGVAGAFAKWWGRKPTAYLIKGGVISRKGADIAGAESDFNDARDMVNFLAKKPTVYAVSGALIIPALVVLTVDWDNLENTGGRAFFTLLGINPRG